jgi:hypothetical protein
MDLLSMLFHHFANGGPFLDRELRFFTLLRKTTVKAVAAMNTAPTTRLATIDEGSGSAFIQVRSITLRR